MAVLGKCATDVPPAAGALALEVSERRRCLSVHFPPPQQLMPFAWW